MKLFLILGNQLFSPRYLKEFSDHIFYMSEDLGLCTFQKHHKLKILLFLSSMRSYRDELKNKKFKVVYNDCYKDFKVSYEKKLERIIKEKKIKEVNFFEIEDIFFEKRLKSFLKKKNINFNEIRFAKSSFSIHFFCGLYENDIIFSVLTIADFIASSLEKPF